MARPKNLAALTGRPSTFNLAQASSVLERMCAGEALTVICRDPDMPAATTVISWAENPKRAWFGTAFRAAQREQARVWSEQRLEIADDTVNATGVHQIYSAQLRANIRGQLAKALDPETWGERAAPAVGRDVTVSIFLPGKPGMGDGARVIEHEPKALEDGREDEQADASSAQPWPKP